MFVSALVIGSFLPLLQDFDGPAPGLCYAFLSKLSTKNRDVTFSLTAEYFFASLQQYYLIDKIQNRNSVKQKFLVLCVKVDKKIAKEKRFLFFLPLSKAVLSENVHIFSLILSAPYKNPYVPKVCPLSGLCFTENFRVHALCTFFQSGFLRLST